MRWIYVLGLDNVGKTSLLTFLETGEMGDTNPTLGVLSKRLTIADKLVTFQEFGGQEDFRKNWLNDETWGYARKKAVSPACAIVYVMDASDQRWEDTKEWFAQVTEGFAKPHLIIINKIDLVDGVDTQALLDQAGIPSDIEVATTSAKEGTNVLEAFKALIEKKFSD